MQYGWVAKIQKKTFILSYAQSFSRDMEESSKKNMFCDLFQIDKAPFSN